METVINRVVHKMEGDTGTCSVMCGQVMEHGLKSNIVKHACGTHEKIKLIHNNYLSHETFNTKKRNVLSELIANAEIANVK